MLIFTAASHSHTEGCVLSGSHHISLREIPPTCPGPDSLPWNAEVELKIATVRESSLEAREVPGGRWVSLHWGQLGLKRHLRLLWMARLTPPCAARQLSQTRSHVCTQPARGSLDPLLVLHQQVVVVQTINGSVWKSNSNFFTDCCVSPL